jgi:hypothetical protein
LTGRNGSRLFVTLLAMWIIVVSFTAQGTAWIQSALATVSGDPSPWWRATLVQAALIGLPVLIFALRWRVVRYRAIFQSWAWATGYVLLLLPTRLLPPVESQGVVLLQALLTLVYWFVVRRWQREKSPIPASGIALALLVGSVAALPWLAWGALGSPLDVLLNGALAIAFGLLVWTILHLAWIPAQRRDPRQPRRDRLTGGLVMGVMLLIMASALSFNGAQLVLMLLLPAFGWAVVATGASPLSACLVVAAPLLLMDTDALSLAVMDRLLTYYFMGALVSVGIGWIFGLLALIPRPDPAKFIPKGMAWAGAALALLVAGAIYLLAGHPGFFGDRIFVLVRGQADLGAVAASSDLSARREAVYHALVNNANATQSGLRAALDRVGMHYRPYYLVNALEVDGGLLARLWLARRDDVAEIMVSPHLRPAQALDLPGEEAMPTPSEAQWNLTSIGADRVWRELGITGEGVVVGQSDSGVQGSHPEFAARYRGATAGNDYNWFDPWEHSTSPRDVDGHGTHTLGTVLGKTVGVAPGATWFGCANLVRNLGNPALYLDCMQFMLAPFPQMGDPFQDGDPSRAADVLNNSWGCPTAVEGCEPEVFAPAVDALTQAGIFVVVSGGNNGPLCTSVNTPPAIYELVLTVGAVDSMGDLATFSSVGPVTVDGSGRIKPDVLAPGVDVLSAWPGDAYNSLSGTSMAGPHLAGTVALMWSANPALRGDVARTKAIIEETARPFHGDLEGGESSPDTEVSDQVAGTVETLVQVADMAGGQSCLTQSDLTKIPNKIAGYGVVDVYAAVQAALALQ